MSIDTLDCWANNYLSRSSSYFYMHEKVSRIEVEKEENKYKQIDRKLRCVFAFRLDQMQVIQNTI